jgi:general secretion pathway protein D
LLTVVIVAVLGCRSSHEAPRPVAEPVPSAAASASAVVALPIPESNAGATAESAGPRRYAFDFEDADLPELVRLISAITGKRFLYTGTIPHLHATSRSPAPVTAEEAYAAFLTILQANGLTVVPRGDVINIIPSASLINR